MTKRPLQKLKSEDYAVPLTKGAKALISNASVALVSQHTWCLDSTGYAVSRIGNKKTYLHRFVTMATGEIDHINRDKLDCRLVNLRQVTRSENSLNVDRRHLNRSGYQGVHWDSDRRKWVAQIRLPGKTIALGRYVSRVDAIKARGVAEATYRYKGATK